MAKDQKTDPKEYINQAMFDSIQSGTLPFRQPWLGPLDCNPFTGTIYNVSNRALLRMAGFTDHRWATPFSLIKHGLDFRGAKKRYLATYVDSNSSRPDKPHEPKDDLQDIILGGALSEKLEDDGSRTYRRLALVGVFNFSEVKGVPSLRDSLKLPPFSSCDIVEALAARMCSDTGLVIEHGGLQAYYSPERHVVRMPAKDLFPTKQDYYAVLLHELGHSTSDVSMLSRTLNTSRSSPSYCLEEMVVEIATCHTLGRFYGVNSEWNLANHASYVGGYAKALATDKNAFWHAAKLAAEVSTMVESFAPKEFLEWEIQERARADREFSDFFNMGPIESIQVAAQGAEPINVYAVHPEPAQESEALAEANPQDDQPALSEEPGPQSIDASPAVVVEQAAKPKRKPAAKSTKAVAPRPAAPKAAPAPKPATPQKPRDPKM